MAKRPDESGNPTDLAQSDLERVRERLSFYERFDQIIQENVSRAGDLLREAASQVESSHSAVTKERLHYRTLFAAMLDEVTSLQGQTERLARRLGDALDEIERNLPPGGLFPPITDLLPGTYDNGSADIADELESSEAERLIAETQSLAFTQQETRTGIAANPPALQNEEADAAAQPEYAQIDAVPDGYQIETVAHAATVDSPPVLADLGGEAGRGQSAHSNGDSGVVSMLLIHNVPRATSALSLKSYVEALSHVRAVEPREFAAGILRLQVAADRELTFADLTGWDQSGRLEALNSGSGLLEVRLLAS